MITQRQTVVDNLNLLYANTKPNAERVIVNSELINNCMNVLDYLEGIGAVFDDGTIFKLSALGRLLIEDEKSNLPWLQDYINGLELTNPKGTIQ